MLVHFLFLSEEKMRNKCQNSKCSGESCNHRREARNRKSSPQTNSFLVFLRKFLIKLKLHAVRLYNFSSNSGV